MGSARFVSCGQAGHLATDRKNQVLWGYKNLVYNSGTNNHKCHTLPAMCPQERHRRLVSYLSIIQEGGEEQCEAFELAFFSRVGRPRMRIQQGL